MPSNLSTLTLLHGIRRRSGAAYRTLAHLGEISHPVSSHMSHDGPCQLFAKAQKCAKLRRTCAVCQATCPPSLYSMAYGAGPAQLTALWRTLEKFHIP